MSDFGAPAGKTADANGNGNLQASKPIPGWVDKEVLDYSAMDGRSGGGAFDGSARVYEYSDEYGDVGPRIPEFEKELFGDAATGVDSGSVGLDFSA